MYLDKLPKPKKERIVVFQPSIPQGLLLMEEILHHVACIKPRTLGQTTNLNWWTPDFWTINSMTFYSSKT